MEESRITDKLVNFGLTKQEAVIYMSLSQNGDLSGYEVAKLTGISRSNVYSGLSGLKDKGAAYLIEGNTSKYTVVPIQQFCQSKIRHLSEDQDFLIKHIPALKKDQEGYITIEGYQNIWDKLINTIQDAKKRIYLSASMELINKLESELIQALDKKIKLVLITDDTPQNAVIRENSILYLGAKREKNIRLIIDSAYALTGELNGDKTDTFLYTGQQNFISVFKEMLSNEMKLIEIEKGNEENE